MALATHQPHSDVLLFIICLLHGDLNYKQPSSVKNAKVCRDSNMSGQTKAVFRHPQTQDFFDLAADACLCRAMSLCLAGPHVQRNPALC